MCQPRLNRSWADHQGGRNSFDGFKEKGMARRG